MNDDGTMARLPDLVKFAQFHNLKIGTIADLIAYRRRTEKLVECIGETTINSRYGGEFKLRLYANKVTYAEHIALVKGDIKHDQSTLVRMHALNVFDDVLGDNSGKSSSELHAAMEMVSRAGCGVIVLIREPDAKSLSRRLSAKMDTAQQAPELRDYGVGAQILLDLGVRDMVLLSNSNRTIVGLDGYGLTITGRQPIIASDS
jgi:3,4-dihydroxy 2-butanone 4-phosphate synthase/GTP cyclohydrolase II